MDANASSQLAALREDLEHYFVLADKTLRDGDLDLHFVYGGQYHRTADRIFKMTGIDPRPPYSERARR